MNWVFYKYSKNITIVVICVLVKLEKWSKSVRANCRRMENRGAWYCERFQCWCDICPLVSPSVRLSILLEDLNQRPAGPLSASNGDKFYWKRNSYMFCYGILRNRILFCNLENSPLFFFESVLSLFVCLFMFSQLLILTKTNSGGVLTNILTLPTTRLQFT